MSLKMKKTLVAICVAMLATACSSSGGDASPSQPNPPAQNPKSEQPTPRVTPPKSEQQDQSQPPVEPLKPERQDQPQPPVTPPKSEQQDQPQPPVTPPKSEQQDQAQPPVEPPKSDEQPVPPVVPPKQEEQLKPPAVRPKPESPVIEWKGERKIDLDGNSLSKDYISLTDHMRVVSVTGGLRVEPKNFAVNLNERSENGLGWNHGSFDGEGLVVNDGTGSNQLNYDIIHQPYSYYGVLYDNNQVNSAGERLSNYQRTEFIGGVYNGDPIEKPTGSASYQSKGDYGVLANLQYLDLETGIAKDNRLETDGNITLTANFDENKVSGTLHSKSLGEVKLNETVIYGQREFLGGTNTSGGGSYRGYFSPNYQDVVGTISNVLGKDDKGDFTYSAVFGATKQEPKPKQ
ncbi:hypothetical protein [Rodentibacter myodis]|uniref:Transferrin-binding protein B C-lobe/N-lobe beta barrel domain-containing protein n=1 Tax=Rodentibacter myodis TaxID=1907939 RepID=A0A1V3JH02_9PAST|nr:hypothetical protein [Rodentibacter myodis]OOF56016.1 hypothetical protein BKL49_10755 [Rodentibacter myodis]